MIQSKSTEVDRSKWGKGPWDGEFDEYTWTDEVSGYACRVRRGPVGAFCGYVSVPKDHPYFGTEGYDLDCHDLDCHGGITYSRISKLKGEEVFVFGFDCSHSGDHIPGMSAYGIRSGDGEVYREFEYVKKEVESLALQLNSATPEGRIIQQIRKEIGI